MPVEGAALPGAEISNGLIHAKLYLPDSAHGFYKGTRFDWSGVVSSLAFGGHDYYGPWFTKTAPDVHDFIYSGSDIIAGPCSAITGPVDEFRPLGFDSAQSGGTFVKIGIGALRKPAAAAYDNYHLYEIANPGDWKIEKHADSIEFTQTLNDPSSGYSYIYRKTVSLTAGKPEMVLRHSLENTGKNAIKTTVYNHNFLVLDSQPPGPGMSITLPFEIKSAHPPHADLAEIRANRILYRAALKDRDTVALPIEGFSEAVADHQIRIENSALGAGMNIRADRPLHSESLWSIRSVVAVEPFISIDIEPGKTFTWTADYEFYTLPNNSKP